MRTVPRAARQRLLPSRLRPKRTSSVLFALPRDEPKPVGPRDHYPTLPRIRQHVSFDDLLLRLSRLGSSRCCLAGPRRAHVATLFPSLSKTTQRPPGMLCRERYQLSANSSDWTSSGYPLVTVTVGTFVCPPGTAMAQSCHAAASSPRRKSRMTLVTLALRDRRTPGMKEC